MMQNRGRLFAIAALGALACGGVTEPARHSVVVTVNPTAIATGEDYGPQDGVFDAFTTANLGSVNNNGFTSFRTAVEYTLPLLPSDAIVDSVALKLAIGAWEGPRSLQVHGYDGDGTVQLTDFALNELVATATLAPVGYQNLSLDVTDFLAAHVARAGAVVGFNIREEPPNAPNYTIMAIRVDPGPPALAIAYRTRH